MSRLAGFPAAVSVDDIGRPESIEARPALPRTRVLEVIDRWREWIGILEGMPERDVWLVETPYGIAELHCLRSYARAAAGTTISAPISAPIFGPDEDAPTVCDWLLASWRD